MRITRFNEAWKMIGKRGRDVCERRGTSHEQHDDDDDDVGGREGV